jgi:hypothetical protein
VTPGLIGQILKGPGVNSADADRTGGATGTYNLADKLTLVPQSYAYLSRVFPLGPIFIPALIRRTFLAKVHGICKDFFDPYPLIFGRFRGRQSHLGRRSGLVRRLQSGGTCAWVLIITRRFFFGFPASLSQGTKQSSKPEFHRFSAQPSSDVRQTPAKKQQAKNG